MHHQLQRQCDNSLLVDRYLQHGGTFFSLFIYFQGNIFDYYYYYYYYYCGGGVLIENILREKLQSLVKKVK